MANLVDEIKTAFSSRKVTAQLLCTHDSFNRNLHIIAESLVYYENEIKSIAQDIGFISNVWEKISAYQSSFIFIKMLKFDQSNPELFMYNHSNLKAFNECQGALERELFLGPDPTLKSAAMLSEIIERNKKVFYRNVEFLVQKKTEMKFD